MVWFLILLLGLALGSFLNVCIHRIPRGESVITPPSHCPRCGKRIRPYDNIPLLSYVLLGGRCRDCRARISIRYPLVEALVGILFVASYARFGLDWALVRALLLIVFLVLIAFIDLDCQIIPFRVSIPGLALGLASPLLPGSQVSLANAVTGAAVGAVFVAGSWLLWRFVLAGAFRKVGVNQKEGMGWGDLPLAAMIGAFVGWQSTVVALFCAVLSGVIVGLLLRAAGRTGRGQPMPFGPFLAFGGLVALFFGSVLFDLYIRAVLGR